MKKRTNSFLCLAALLLGTTFCQGFLVTPRPSLITAAKTRLYARKKKANTNINPNNNNKDGEVGEGDNWIERSFPVDTGGKDEAGAAKAALKKVEDYNLGISGISFQTGSLSKRTLRKGSFIFLCILVMLRFLFCWQIPKYWKI